MKRFAFIWRAAALAAALLLSPVLAGQASAQAVIGSVEVSGNRRVPVDQILNVINLRSGDTVVAADIDRAMRRVLATGQFSDLNVFVVGDSANAAVPVTLRFALTEHPVISQIEFRGLENVRGSLIRDTVGLQPGQPLNPDKVARAEEMTRRLLAEKGYRLLSMEHRVEPLPGRPDDYALIFEAEEGGRVAIAEIDFTGNEAYSDDDLRDVLGTKTEGFLWFRTGMFNDEKLREDLRGSLPQFYASNGYLDFAIVDDSLEVDPETGKGRLIIDVAEGAQYRLAEFDVRGASRFASEDLRRYFEQRRTGLLSGFGLGGARDVGTRAGEVFDLVAFQQATSDVQRLYNNQGYLYAQVNPVVERVPADSTGQPGIRAAWEIVEGNPASVRRVEIVGNTFTHENVIRNQILMVPGDIYGEDLLIQSYRRVGALGFFEAPMAPPRIEETGTGDVDIIFEVKEKQTGSVNFGTSLGGSLGLQGFIGYDQPNLFGLAKSGHLRWEFGKYSNNFEASYSDPSIADSWLSGSLSLFNSTDRFFTFSEGRRRRLGASARVGLPLPWDRRYSRFTVGYSLSRTSYENFEDDDASSLFSLPPGVQSTVTLGVSRMALDHPMFPTVGSRQEIEASLSGGPLQGDGDFQKYSMSGAWYVPVGSLGGGNAPGQRPIRFTLGLTMEAGALFGDASRFPFDRFWMGGVQFGRPLRGYDETTITPRGYIPKDAQGVPLSDRFGDAYLRLSAEYAVRFTDNISLGVFYDAGNVWREPAQMDPTRLLRGAGAGIMIVTPFGPLGLDYAYGFDKDRPGWQLHFKFGQGM